MRNIPVRVSNQTVTVHGDCPPGPKGTGKFFGPQWAEKRASPPPATRRPVPARARLLGIVSRHSLSMPAAAASRTVRRSLRRGRRIALRFPTWRLPIAPAIRQNQRILTPDAQVLSWRFAAHNAAEPPRRAEQSVVSVAEMRCWLDCRLSLRESSEELTPLSRSERRQKAFRNRNSVKQRNRGEWP